jgi:hypothetical protein
MKNQQSFKQFLSAVQDQTTCSIRIMGLEKREDFVWIWFQSESKEALQKAFMTVNMIVSSECKMVPLEQPETKSISNENMKKLSSFEDEEDIPDKNAYIKSNKRSLIRSTTTDFSASRTALEESKPFGSVLSKFVLTSIKDDDNPFTHSETTRDTRLVVDENNNDNLLQKPVNKTIHIVKDKHDPKCCYSVDFLLQRANSVHSKKMPTHWKDLNEKYPNFCFYGKVCNIINNMI